MSAEQLVDGAGRPVREIEVPDPVEYLTTRQIREAALTIAQAQAGVIIQGSRFIDISDELSEFLDRTAESAASLEAAGYPGMPALPEFVALVRRIGGAR